MILVQSSSSVRNFWNRRTHFFICFRFRLSDVELSPFVNLFHLAIESRRRIERCVLIASYETREGEKVEKPGCVVEKELKQKEIVAPGTKPGSSAPTLPLHHRHRPNHQYQMKAYLLFH